MFLTAFLISLEVGAQNVKVSGVVTDALGPIPGANIMEEGTTNGTVTDVNGKYSIQCISKLISFIISQPQSSVIADTVLITNNTITYT